MYKYWYIWQVLLGDLPYFNILHFDIWFLYKMLKLISGIEEKDEIMFWLKSFVVVQMKGPAMWMPRRLWTQTRVKGCPKRYLHCPRACTSQWIISDKVIRPPIHMVLGVFSNPTSPLPASCPFREVVNTVVGVAAKCDSFLNTFQIPLIRSTLLCLASFHETLQSTLWVSDIYS